MPFVLHAALFLGKGRYCIQDLQPYGETGFASELGVNQLVAVTNAVQSLLWRQENCL